VVWNSILWLAWEGMSYESQIEEVVEVALDEPKSISSYFVNSSKLDISAEMAIKQPPQFNLSAHQPRAYLLHSET
jgi:hypothetical protein